VVLHPAIIALLLGSLLTAAMMLYGAHYGVRILRSWDLSSGSELQLGLERRTYLISTMMSYAFGFQLLSLFLFLYTADKLNTLFVGAMCAAGTLNVNAFGYPTILLKIVNFLLAGLWLIVNHTDSRAWDYPLIRKKYRLLLVILPFILAETMAQAVYLLSLRPNVITSCCGTLFSSEAPGMSASLASVSPEHAHAALYTSMAVTFGSGLYFHIKGRAGSLFSLASLATFIVAIVALISLISLYIYELPTHHCPFCILQREYGYLGYPMYLSLLAAAVCGTGAGAIARFRAIESLAGVLPPMQRRLTMTSLLCFGIFLAISVWAMVTSNLRL
jgi:hypothetical protein